MTVTARLVAAIWLTVLAVGAGFAYFQIAGEHERLLRDLDQRAVTRAERIKAAIEPLDEFELATQIGALVAEHERPGQAIAIHDRHGERLAVSKDAGLLPSDAAEVAAALATGEERRALLESGGRSAYAYVAPIERNGEPAGAVSVVVDASEVAEADRALWGRTAIRLVIVASVVSLVAAWILRAGVTRPMRRMAEWARALHAGKSVPPPPIGDRALFDPLASELSRFGVSLRRAQAAAEREAALRLHADSSWTEERLKQFVTSQLASPLFVVSNREPVIHVWKGRKIEAHTPASGMVSAVEPVVRACGGVWIAHASGDADREVVDASGRVGVPPDHPDFTLRRVWLSPEEEQGYYYGFSNEGIWPLCHIAHARPLFRPEDWEHYREVNRKFADALLEEMAGAESPLVLIQDYHFALLPALVKKERPDARIALFWHIPWPNSEAFGICPWQDDLLLGMLGSDLVGFHTQYHCNNFLETIERAIEARVDWERFSVVRGDHTTYVKPLPISVAPTIVDDPPRVPRATLLASLGVQAEIVGVGVERLDYTKGIPERVRALGRLFELHPEHRGRLTFVQLAAPSRSRIPRYQQLQAEVEQAVREVNERFGNAKWKPIHYSSRHHDHREIWPLYRAADFCMVTSLHDGMNLVAKEFVASRDDGDGVLILSRFTGAADELRDAVLVNPYDLDGMAEAIRVAAEMPEEERRVRMGRMRRAVHEHNVYRWAGSLLSELSRIPESAARKRAVAEARSDSPEIAVRDGAPA